MFVLFYILLSFFIVFLIVCMVSCCLDLVFGLWTILFDGNIKHAIYTENKMNNWKKKKTTTH